MFLDFCVGRNIIVVELERYFFAIFVCRHFVARRSYSKNSLL